MLIFKPELDHAPPRVPQDATVSGMMAGVTAVHRSANHYGNATTGAVGRLTYPQVTHHDRGPPPFLYHLLLSSPSCLRSATASAITSCRVVRRRPRRCQCTCLPTTRARGR